MDPFVLLQKTLDESGLTSDPAWKHVIPATTWSTDANSTATHLKEFLIGRNPAATDEPLVLCVDGVRKLYSGSSKSADDVILEACKAVGFARAELLNVSPLLGVDPEHLHASAEHLPTLRKTLKERAAGGAVCVLCTGTLTDLVKHAMFLEGMASTPLVIVPTAITVTAFTSTFAVIDESGKKCSLMSRCPDANFWDFNVLKVAPPALSRAGYGDMLARLLAYGDWYLAHELGMVDRYDERAFRITAPFMELLKRIAKGFAAEALDESTARASAACLVMAGVAMSTSGETTPLSGYEHEISHALDFLRYVGKDPLALHGEQVALSCLTSAAAYEWLLSLHDLDEIELRVPTAAEVAKDCAVLCRSAPFVVEPGAPHVLSPEARAAVGKAEERFASEVVAKNERFRAVLAGSAPGGASWAAVQGRWAAIRGHLRALVTPYREVRALVEAAGIATEPEGLVVEPRITREQYEWAVSFAPYVRRRFSVGDLLYWAGTSGNLIPHHV